MELPVISYSVKNLLRFTIILETFAAQKQLVCAIRAGGSQATHLQQIFTVQPGHKTSPQRPIMTPVCPRGCGCESPSTSLPQWPCTRAVTTALCLGFPPGAPFSRPGFGIRQSCILVCSAGRRRRAGVKSGCERKQSGKGEPQSIGLCWGAGERSINV